MILDSIGGKTNSCRVSAMLNISWGAQLHVDFVEFHWLTHVVRPGQFGPSS